MQTTAYYRDSSRYLDDKYPTLTQQQKTNCLLMSKNIAGDRRQTAYPAAPTAVLDSKAKPYLEAQLTQTVDTSYPFHADLANAIIVAAALLLTITFVGFAAAPGSNMPQGYNIPSNNKDTSWAASTVFWYVNAASFSTAAGSFFCALRATWMPAFLGSIGAEVLKAKQAEIRRRAMLLTATLLLGISSSAAYAAFVVAAWVALTWPHSLIITLLLVLVFPGTSLILHTCSKWYAKNLTDTHHWATQFDNRCDKI